MASGTRRAAALAAALLLASGCAAATPEARRTAAVAAPRVVAVPLAGRWPAIETVLGSGLDPQRNGLPGRIRPARLRLGLTQEELARRRGVTSPLDGASG